MRREVQCLSSNRDATEKNAESEYSDDENINSDSESFLNQLISSAMPISAPESESFLHRPRSVWEGTGRNDYSEGNQEITIPHTNIFCDEQSRHERERLRHQSEEVNYEDLDEDECHTYRVEDTPLNASLDLSVLNVTEEDTNKSIQGDAEQLNTSPDLSMDACEKDTYLDQFNTAEFTVKNSNLVMRKYPKSLFANRLSEGNYNLTDMDEYLNENRTDEDESNLVGKRKQLDSKKETRRSTSRSPRGSRKTKAIAEK